MIGPATWVLWVHILAAMLWLGGAAVQRLAVLPSGASETGRRTHVLTSRAMEILVVTGVANILVRAMAYGASFSPAFFAMLAVKMALLAAMAGVQLWMGFAWREADPLGHSSRFRLALLLQLALGSLAVLLGLGLRAV